MNFVAYLRSLADKFFRRSQVAGEMDEELRSHIELRADDLERSGVSRAEAERQARIEFGGEGRFKEECHEALGGNFIESVINDVRYALRMLRKSPGFTLTAVLTLALAIGANAVVFAMLNALILRPLNVPQPESLYAIERDASFLDPSQSYPDYLDLRDRNRSFEGLAGYTITPAALQAGNSLSSVWTTEATGNYFDELRIQPYLGRFFHSSDEHGPNSAPYIVLNYAYWHNHFKRPARRGPSSSAQPVPLHDCWRGTAGVSRDAAVF
jgi:MacB-like periplasmic core domain